MTQFIHQPHDKLFKRSMADIRVAREFFEAHLPPEVAQKIDLDTLELQKQTFIDEAYKATEADIVYTAKMGDSLVYLYMLCEHQSEIDRMIAFRLWVYMARIIELHRSRYPNSLLPIVYSMVVYSGEKPWDAPLEIFDLFGENKSMAKEMLLQPYHLIDIHRMKDEELEKHSWSGLVEYVLKYRRARDVENFLDKLFPWLSKIEMYAESDTSFIRVVLNYVVDGIEANESILLIQKSEQYLSEKLRGEVMTFAQCFRQEGMQQGLQQGVQQGIKEERQEMALRLLKEGLSLSLAAKVTELPLEQLQKIQDQLCAAH